MVGAPCGIMDQMTSALGRADALLALLCQPAEVQGFVALPPSIGFWGIDSGIRHAVSGSDYTSVRTGAFMGYRIIAEAAGLRVTDRTDDGVVQIDDPRWSGYLANLSPEEFDRDFASRLPETMRGEEFLRQYGGTTDRVTRVDPARTYAVRQPTAHPIREHARVRRFAELLAGRVDEAGARGDGRAHVRLARQLLRLRARFRRYRPAGGAGAPGRAGGGSVRGQDHRRRQRRNGRHPGTGRRGSAVAEIARRYHEQTGREPYVFAGSSPGACGFGVRDMCDIE